MRDPRKATAVVITTRRMVSASVLASLLLQAPATASTAVASGAAVLGEANGRLAMSEHERQDGSSGVAAGERPEDEAERLAAMVRDPRNRVLGVFYANKADPRVIVPKSTMRPGWTINFGHRYATLFLLLTFVIVLGPGVAVLVFGVATPVTLALTVVLGIVAVAVFASYMSRVGL